MNPNSLKTREMGPVLSHPYIYVSNWGYICLKLGPALMGASYRFVLEEPPPAVGYHNRHKRKVGTAMPGDRASGCGPQRGTEDDIAQIMNIVVEPRHGHVTGRSVSDDGPLQAEVTTNYGCHGEGVRGVAG